MQIDVSHRFLLSMQIDGSYRSINNRQALICFNPMQLNNSFTLKWLNRPSVNRLTSIHRAIVVCRLCVLVRVIDCRLTRLVRNIMLIMQAPLHFNEIFCWNIIYLQSTIKTNRLFAQNVLFAKCTHKTCSSLVLSLSLSLGVIKERKRKVAIENMFVNIAETEGSKNNNYKK